MARLLWIPVNIGQAAFTAAWTGLWVTTALLIMSLTRDRRIPLTMARRIWAPGLLWCVGAKLDIRGLENVDFSRPHVFVSNHDSTIDIPVIFAAIPANLSFIIKKELKYAPFVGLFAWATGMTFVDRQETRGALARLKRLGQVIAAGQSVIAFPEGTRNHGDTLLPFKKGAFFAGHQAGVPIVPLAIEGSREVMPPPTWALRPGTIRVTIGAPIQTAGLSREDSQVLPALAREAVAALRNRIPTGNTAEQHGPGVKP
jgi:1-acyl-sn-glycerol-3-phosphate acyltransferase